MQVMHKRSVIINFKAGLRYTYHPKEILIVRGTTRKYLFIVLKKRSLFLQVWLGFTNT